MNTPTVQLEQFQAQINTLQQQLKERDQTILEVVRYHFLIMLMN